MKYNYSFLYIYICKFASLYKNEPTYLCELFQDTTMMTARAYQLHIVNIKTTDILVILNGLLFSNVNRSNKKQC